MNATAVTLREGDQVRLFDLHGRETLYTLTADRDAVRYAFDAALLKPVFFSSEQKHSSSGDSTLAVNVNDGVAGTAWVAGEVQKKRYQYPERIAMDLGREYRLSEIELQFETRDYRIYQFQIFASSDTPPVSREELPDNYRLILDQSGNRAYDDGHYRFALKDETARYVAVKVLGNTLYPSTLTAAAGIYDLKVYGVPCE